MNKRPLLPPPYRLADLFAGIGGLRLGFEAIDCETVFSCDWDESARQVYYSNFGELPFGDINDIAPTEIPDHDILLAGFPCQPFSIAGKELGFADTRGTLFFNIATILQAKRPRAFLLENVKRLTTHDEGRTLQTILTTLRELGYTVYHKVLNSLHFGIPQKRERVYLVGFVEPIAFSFPRPLGYYKPLADLLEPDEEVEQSYFLSPTIRAKRWQALKEVPPYPSIWHENIGGNISPLPYSCALRAGGSYNYLVVNGVRRLTTREMLRLQGFPETFKLPLPYSQARKVIGNAVTVPVIEAIAKEMLLTLTGDYKAERPAFQLSLWGE